MTSAGFCLQGSSASLFELVLCETAGPALLCVPVAVFCVVNSTVLILCNMCIIR